MFQTEIDPDSYKPEKRSVTHLLRDYRTRVMDDA